MRYYKALIEIPAENEDDFKEQLDALDSYELEWWCEAGKLHKIDLRNFKKQVKE